MPAKICEIFIHLKFDQPSLMDVDTANKPNRRMPARLKIWRDREQTTLSRRRSFIKNEGSHLNGSSPFEALDYT
jgi:hypothetical protein